MTKLYILFVCRLRKLLEKAVIQELTSFPECILRCEGKREKNKMHPENLTSEIEEFAVITEQGSQGEANEDGGGGEECSRHNSAKKCQISGLIVYKENVYYQWLKWGSVARTETFLTFLKYPSSQRYDICLIFLYRMN